MMTLKEYRKHRDRAGILAYLAVMAEKKGHGDKAWKIFNKWLKHRITYTEAKKQLEKLTKTRANHRKH